MKNGERGEEDGEQWRNWKGGGGRLGVPQHKVPKTQKH